jgi:chaperonin GroEL
MTTNNDQLGLDGEEEIDWESLSPFDLTGDKIKELATTLSGDEEIGELVVDAMERVGKDGTIVVEEGVGTTTVLEILTGMEFEKGFQSPYFITDTERGEAVLEDASVLTYDGEITGPDTVDGLAHAVESKGGSLVIIGELGGDALRALARHAESGSRVAAVSPPGFGDRRVARLVDIAVLTGGGICTSEDEIQLSELGRCQKVVIENDRTILIGGAGTEDSIAARTMEIRRKIEETTSDYDREKLQERLTSVVGGVALVRTGGSSVSELKKKARKIENVVSRLQLWIREGE